MNVKDFEKLEIDLVNLRKGTDLVLKGMKETGDLSDVYAAYLRTAQFLDQANLILDVIRTDVLDRFSLLQQYRLEDYEDAMNDLNQILELLGK